MRSDFDLARRIEQSGATFSIEQAVALATIAPESGSVGVPLDGGALIALGPGRYVNRAIGLGFGGTPAAEIVGALDSFYGERGMPPSLELSPLADPALLPALTADGFVLERFRNVYAHDLTSLPPEPAEEIVAMDATTTEPHKEILAGGLMPGSPARLVSDEFCDAMWHLASSQAYLALLDGRPAACGSLANIDGVGWVGGAATLASHRGRGLQTALVNYRLRRANEIGCDIVAATALADGQSAQNLVRLGFQLLYTQVVLTKP